jgi:hypothetical protein
LVGTGPGLVVVAAVVAEDAAVPVGVAAKTGVDAVAVEVDGTDTAGEHVDDWDTAEVDLVELRIPEVGRAPAATGARLVDAEYDQLEVTAAVSDRTGVQDEEERSVPGARVYAHGNELGFAEAVVGIAAAFAVLDDTGELGEGTVYIDRAVGLGLGIEHATGVSALRSIAAEELEALDDAE